MDPGIEGFGCLGIDVALTHDAAETDLHMLAGAAEPIVQIEMSERGVEIVAPHQADRPFAEPDAFGLGGRPVMARLASAISSMRPAASLAASPAFPVSVDLESDSLGMERKNEDCRAEKDRNTAPNDTEHDRTVCLFAGL